MNTILLEQARQLSMPDQLELIDALWDNISAQRGFLLPTEAQKLELDRRLAELETDPDSVVPWSDVKAAALARIRQ